MAPDPAEPGAAAPETGRIVQQFGRVGILEAAPGQSDPGGKGVVRASAADLTEADLTGLSEAEHLAVEALRIRESAAFRTAKQQRSRDGESWDLGDCVGRIAPTEAGLTAAAVSGPTSARLEGSVALGIVFVSGPGELAISAAEKTKILAEIQEGIGWYVSVAPATVSLFFAMSPETVDLDLPKADLDLDDREKYWLDPALKYLQTQTVLEYVNGLRTTHATEWAYCAFFTKYPLRHPGYAMLGGPYLVMDTSGSTWGPDNIDRVFAHETGHIFGCPDEYESAPCACGQLFGRFKVPNGNCETRAVGRGTPCVMKANTFQLCDYTPSHLGWSVQGPLLNHNSLQVADIANAGRGDGTTALQWPYAAGSNQRFHLQAVGHGELRVTADHSGKVLTVSGGSTLEGADVVQWVWGNRDHQRFTLEDVGGGVYALKAKHSGMVLDVAAPYGRQGSRLVQSTYTGQAHQQWTYRGQWIMALHSGKVMDVRGGSVNDGTPIIQFSPGVGDNQLFLVEELEGGYVRLVAAHCGKVLDVTGGSQANGAELILWPWGGGDNQRFKIVPVSDDHVRIVAKHSGKVLDVRGSSVDDGVPVVQWDWNLGANQRWKLL
ncbi:RICIN domain-containing protein [Streptomyces sp. SAS_270]|uniref:RICIN domain-containing protein n=1 Tax=Streptomyces sp. SAS_270 TaxID=3412748 RepID=UPI00403D3197